MSHHKYIMNGWRKLILEYVLYNGHHNLIFSHGLRSKLSCLYSTFYTKIEWFWTDSCNSQHHQPFHLPTISIMNGYARLRFEFIMYNQCHTLAFELWVATRSAPEYPTFHTKMVYVLLVQEYHSISTLPTSNLKYEWLEKVEIITASQPFQHLI